MGCTPWPADMVSSKQRRPVCRILSFGEDPPVEEGTQRRIPSNVPVPRLAPAIALPTSSAATAQSAAAPAAIAATETPHHLEEDTSPVLHKPANRSKRRRVVVSTDSSEKTHKRRGDDKSAVDVASSSSLSPAPPSPPVLLPESDSPSNLYRFVASLPATDPSAGLYTRYHAARTILHQSRSTTLPIDVDLLAQLFPAQAASHTMATRLDNSRCHLYPRKVTVVGLARERVAVPPNYTEKLARVAFPHVFVLCFTLAMGSADDSESYQARRHFIESGWDRSTMRTQLSRVGTLYATALRHNPHRAGSMPHEMETAYSISQVGSRIIITEMRRRAHPEVRYTEREVWKEEVSAYYLIRLIHKLEEIAGEGVLRRRALRIEHWMNCEAGLVDEPAEQGLHPSGVDTENDADDEEDLEEDEGEVDARSDNGSTGHDDDSESDCAIVTQFRSLNVRKRATLVLSDKEDDSSSQDGNNQDDSQDDSHDDSHNDEQEYTSDLYDSNERNDFSSNPDDDDYVPA